MSAPLSLQSPAAAGAAARRKDAKIGVVHFGPGAFHRAHQAWYFHRLLETDPRWGIAEVALKTPGVRDALSPQDGLYVLTELDSEVRFEVMTPILRLLVAAEDPDAVLTLLASPDVGVITTTVTEKGYCLDGEGKLDLSHPDIREDLAGRPTSIIGYVTEGLRRRRAAGLPAPAVISCDNLADNGRLFKAAVMRLAEQTDPDLARWIEDAAAFPRTMVDSITPATDDALRARVAAATGIHDAWPVQRERFCQWVIEDILPPGAPDLASVGADLTSDVAGYEAAKLRLLNGAHSSLAYMGLLRGHKTVGEAMADAELAAFVEAMMCEDIRPTVKAPAGFDVDAYIAAVLDRFRNPEIRHLLSQIAWDGSKKLPFRILGTVADALAAGRSVDRLATPLAAWMAFIVRQAKADAVIVDPLADELAAIGRACTGDAAYDVAAFLQLHTVFGKPDPRLVNAITRAYGRTEGFAAPVVQANPD